MAAFSAASLLFSSRISSEFISQFEDWKVAGCIPNNIFRDFKSKGRLCKLNNFHKSSIRCGPLSSQPSSDVTVSKIGGRVQWKDPLRKLTGTIDPLKEAVEAATSGKLSNVLTQFKMADFSLYSIVSIGLCARSDELLFEGVVQNPTSPLRGMRVVLRSLTGPRAVRWGYRALTVMPRLVRGEAWHHPYTTKLHGFILPSEDNPSLTLVHGYYGSYSLHQWLLCDNWLPLLETRLALHEDPVRRIGDEQIGGREVIRQLRVLRVVLRDVLIGVNYLHSRGMAHLDIRLQNVHISAADRRVKVAMLGKARDFPQEASNNLPVRQRMIASDVRSVGLMMARMVLRELINPQLMEYFNEFLRQGHHPASLREYLRPILLQEQPVGSTGLQMLDLDGGAGWHLLAAMLDPRPESRISCQDSLRHPFLCGPRWRRGESLPNVVQWAVGSAAVRIAEEFIYLPEQRQRLQQLIGIIERMNAPISAETWKGLSSGKWRMLYHTGRMIGTTMRQASPSVLVRNVILTITPNSENVGESSPSFSATLGAEISFTVLPQGPDWPHDKKGTNGLLTSSCEIQAITGARLYNTAESDHEGGEQSQGGSKDKSKMDIAAHLLSYARRRGTGRMHRPKKERSVVEGEASLPMVQLVPGELDLGVSFETPLTDIKRVQQILQEVRVQIPRDIFDLTDLVCVSALDSRLMVLKGVSGASILLARSS